MRWEEREPPPLPPSQALADEVGVRPRQKWRRSVASDHFLTKGLSRRRKMPPGGRSSSPHSAFVSLRCIGQAWTKPVARASRGWRRGGPRCGRGRQNRKFERGSHPRFRPRPRPQKRCAAPVEYARKSASRGAGSEWCGGLWRSACMCS